MKIKSFAKVNLGLEVIGKREDNYHEIKTVFQTIDFYDVLEFKARADNAIHLQGNDESIPWSEENLIYKAVLLLREHFNNPRGVEICVSKNIPSGKGLGGGSSNAAMTLYALNELWELGLKKNELMSLGRKLGADVPYFLEGGLCLGLGRGDEIIPFDDIPPFSCILVLPDFSILTASVYGQVRTSSLTSGNKGSKISRFLDGRDLSILENNLEETVLIQYPQLQRIKSLLCNLGSELSLISGTGSAVFGLFPKKDIAERAFEKLKKRGPSLLVETLSRERYWSNLKAGV